MAASETDIANLALQKIGESRINSLNDQADKNARVCKLNYDQARGEALMMCRWRFAKKQAAISKLIDPPLYKWQAAYQLPADLLRLTEIEGDDVWNPKQYFDIQGRKLFVYFSDDFDSAADSLNIEYIFDEDVTTSYDPLFVNVLALKLASMIARPLTGSDQLGQMLEQELVTVALPKAMEVNGHQLYTDKNHPIHQIMNQSFLRRSRRTPYQSNTGLDN